MRGAFALFPGCVVILCGVTGSARSSPSPTAPGATGPPIANPPVTANIEHASLAEAVAILRKASGLDVRLYRSRNGELGASQTAALHWTGVPFGRALRELCQAFQVSCDRCACGYRIVPTAQAADDEFPAQHAGASAYSGAGLRIVYRGAVWGSRFQPEFEPERNRLTIKPEGTTESLDASEIAECINVVGRDDHGNLITCHETPPPIPVFRPRGESYPDRWRSVLAFPFVDPHVRKLEWVEGEIFARRTDHTSLSLPFHIGAPVAHRRFVGADTEIEIYPDRTGDHGEKEGPSIEIRQTSDPGRSIDYRDLQAEFVGRSGWAYQPHGRASSCTSENGVTFQKIDLDFPPIDEPITEVLVGAGGRGDLYRLTKLRLTNLMLPAAPRTRAENEAPPEPPRGELTFLVQIGAGALPAGPVSIGLSRKEHNGWAPVRWQMADIDEKGVAHLAEVAPGTYRIIRRFRAQKPLPAGGRWIDETVTATVTGGKPTSLPPLRWSASGGR
jgi:hypothetical protein